MAVMGWARTEASIERAFATRMKKVGVDTIKLNVQGNRGVPDRLVLLPNGRVVFVEFKRPGERLRPLQAHWHNKLESMGFIVLVFDDTDTAARYVSLMYHRARDERHG